MASNPLLVDCPANQWTKVATNVVTGQVWRMTSAPSKYLQTYRVTADPAPTDKSEGVGAFADVEKEIISASSAIDVYLYPVDAAGRVRVDI